MSRKMIDPQLLANISRRSVLGTSLGLGALAATELLGGFRSSAATSGPPLGQPGPDMGKLATGQFPAGYQRSRRGRAVLHTGPGYDSALHVPVRG